MDKDEIGRYGDVEIMFYLFISIYLYLCLDILFGITLYYLSRQDPVYYFCPGSGH